MMPFLSHREFDDFKVETRHAVERLEQKVEAVTDEVAGLRADVRLIAKVGLGLVALANLAIPFIIYWLGHH